jgi:Phosphodiester glycosidase
MGHLKSPFRCTSRREALVYWFCRGFSLAFLLGAAPVSAHAESRLSTSSPGLTYSNWSVSEVPWSIHVVQVERTNPAYQIESIHAGGRALGLDTLDAQLRLIDPGLGCPVAAVNGDFYQRDKAYAGAPRGLQVVKGQLLCGPSGAPCCWTDVLGESHATAVASQFQITWPDGQVTPFGLNGDRPVAGVELYTPAVGPSTHTVGGRELVLTRAAGSPWLPLRLGRTYTTRVHEIREAGDTPMGPDILVVSLGPAAVRSLPNVQTGAVLRIATASVPALPGIRTAIGGGPILVRNGKRQKLAGEAGEAYEISSRFERHPRTAVGWNQRYFFLVEVDGRQRDLSVGMTLDELSQFLLRLGCQEAVSLDGGGSAALWHDGKIRNNPCDGYDRPIANALVVVKKAGKNGASPAASSN